MYLCMYLCIYVSMYYLYIYISMYLCIYVRPSHIAKYKSNGKAANPARDQLNRECSCLSGIVFILTAQLLHSCLETITTTVFRLSVQVHRVRRSTGRSGVQVNRVRRSTGRSGVQVHGVRRSRHVEGRNYVALLEIGAPPKGRCPPLGLLSLPPTLSVFRVCFLLYDVN